MKKSIAILSVLATSAAFAATTVESDNTFGFVPVEGKGLTCVAVPVKGYTTGTSIKIAEVLQVTDLAEGDKLYTMASGGAYNEYTLSSEGTWTPSKIVTVGGDGDFGAKDGTPATEAQIAPGGAFWLDTKAATISLMGDATEAASAATITTGWQLIGNPSITADCKISDIGGTRTIGDVLQTSSMAYRYVKIGDVTGWATGSGKSWTLAPDAVLKPGEGAMLYSQAAAN